jgi:amidase
MAAGSAYIDPVKIGTAGTTVAVKDIVDLAGLVTTAGCRALERAAVPAAADAACMAGLRAAVAAGEARIVGKTNMTELALGADGLNDWFGTPVNPLDPTLIPGGSSSGSAVAVANGEAEVGIGTDTGGSVRVPAACCGIVGLKTTHGRIPTEGVLPLAESLDSVGPLGRDVAAVVRGMELLEPGFTPGEPARSVGRVRVPDENPIIKTAVDRALAEAGFEVVEVELPGWVAAHEAAYWIGLPEAARNDGALADRDPENLMERTRQAIALGRELAPREEEGRRAQREWQAEVATFLAQFDLLAWPSLADFPPPLENASRIDDIAHSMVVNFAGLPALAQPLPTPGPLPASLQLTAPAHGEETLVATAALIESATG